MYMSQFVLLDLPLNTVVDILELFPQILNVLADGPYQPPSTYRFIRDLPRSRDKRWSVSLKSHNVS